MNKPKITFLTRNYPPNPNINGESVWDMVKYLSEQFQIESRIICMEKEVEGGGAIRAPIGEVIRLRPMFKGKKGMASALSAVYEGYQLVRHALKFSESLIIVTTSPPLILCWASRMLGKKRRWALWSFDLFPEVFQRENVISENSMLYKWLIKQSYKNAPEFIIALGQKQAAHLQGIYKKNIPSLTLPCGVLFFQEKSKTPPSWWNEDKTFFGYCGRIGNAHNPEIIKAVIDHLDPTQQQLVLALYGTHAEEIKAYAKSKEGVIVVDFVPRNQLHFIDVHIISLRKEWTHIAVPSKAVSAVFMGGAILYCGDRESDNWDMFQKAGWLIEEEENIASQVQVLMSKLTKKVIQEKREETPALIEQLQQHVLESYEAVAEKLG